MTTNQLKKLLIAKIDDTNDDELLKAIYTILDYNSSSGEIYTVNDKQRKSIEEAQDQIKRGEIVTNEDLEKEIDKWLNK